MNADERRLNAVTERVIEAAFKVANTLGVGFLDKVYENALTVELRRLGLDVVQQAAVQVHYEGSVVGDYLADMIVQGEVLVELKAVKAFRRRPCGPVFELPQCNPPQGLSFVEFRHRKDRHQTNRSRAIKPFSLICVHPRPSAVPSPL